MIASLSEVFQGKRSLVVSFWVWVVLLTHIMNTVSIKIDTYRMRALVGDRALELIANSFVFLSLAVFLVGMVGTIRTQIYKRKIWKILAVIYVIIAFFASIFLIVLPLLGVPVFSAVRSQIAVLEMKKDMPTKISDELSITDIQYVENHFVYYYTLDEGDYDLDKLIAVDLEDCKIAMEAIDYYSLDGLNYQFYMNDMFLGVASVNKAICRRLEDSAKEASRSPSLNAAED